MRWEDSSPTAPFRLPNVPAALALVSAVYDYNVPQVTLVFNRAINIAAFVPSAITVDDPVDIGALLTGSGGSPVGANGILIYLADPLPPVGTVATLTATAANGIVAADDASAWEGVSEFPL